LILIPKELVINLAPPSSPFTVAAGKQTDKQL